MYEAYFKLHARPFLATPDPARYFPAGSAETARRALVRIVERAEGPAVVIGPPGTGKSMICQIVAQHFAERMAVALLVHGRYATRRALLQAILFELRLPHAGLEEGELRLVLLDYLAASGGSNECLLLVIDEAHALNWRLLEEVRLLTNVIRGGRPRVRVILAGNGLLEERLASPRLASLSQRLAGRCYLGPFDAPETAAYLRSQMAAVGGDENIFLPEAASALYRITDGTPRVVNQLCDHALTLACLGGRRQVSAQAIEEAWADLQQLPAPWSASATARPAQEVVEFGGLDDLGDEPRESIPFPAVARPVDETLTADALEDAGRRLSKVDHEFEAIGTIGTELELGVPEFGDPFEEAFAEEEIVLDRYNGDADLFRSRPRVSSLEGHVLAPLFDALAAKHPVAALTAAIRLSAEPAGAAVDTTPWETDEPEESEACPSNDRGVTVVRQPLWPNAEGTIVIVDQAGPGPAGPPAPHFTSSPRQREFRRLFATLRRG